MFFLNDLVCLLRDTLAPTAWSWLVIVGPLAVMLVLLVIARSADKPLSGMWEWVGRRWLRIGLGGLIAALVCYGAAVYAYQNDPSYQRTYVSRVIVRMLAESELPVQVEFKEYVALLTLGNFEEFVSKLRNEEAAKNLDEDNKKLLNSNEMTWWDALVILLLLKGGAAHFYFSSIYPHLFYNLCWWRDAWALLFYLVIGGLIALRGSAIKHAGTKQLFK